LVESRKSEGCGAGGHGITQDEQVVWTQPPGVAVPATIDVGGPLETVAVHRSLDLVEVREPDGDLRWQEPGQEVQVDPNGDVVLMARCCARSQPPGPNPSTVSKFSP
jgi:hypothetical protein